MKSLINNCMLLLFTLALASCGTIAHGTKQTVSFNSNPPQATLVIVNADGSHRPIGTTPCQVELKRKTKQVKLIKEGYVTQTVNLRKMAKISGWYWADVGGILVFGAGFIGITVDVCDGAWLQLPDNVSVELDKK